MHLVMENFLWKAYPGTVWLGIWDTQYDLIVYKAELNSNINKPSLKIRENEINQVWSWHSFNMECLQYAVYPKEIYTGQKLQPSICTLLTFEQCIGTISIL